MASSSRSWTNGWTLLACAVTGVGLLVGRIWLRPLAIDANVCEVPVYTVRTLSYDPLIQHIENFVTPKEIQKLLELAENKFKPSTSQYPNGSSFTSPRRTSWSAHLPSQAAISQCILNRASEYQGFASVSDIENLQLTRYYPGQFFNNHYDWMQEGDETGPLYDRDTTFFITLSSNCTDCGTNFPLLGYDWTSEDRRWCRFVDCNATVADGLTIQPVPGSAVFWKNLHENGRGDQRMLHSGLPVRDGAKIGLNVWTSRNFLMESRSP